MPPERIYRPRKKKWPRQRGRWLGFGRQWRALRAVLMLTAVLFSTSCATTRKSQKSRESEQATEAMRERHDTAETATRLILTESVPQSRAEIGIPLPELKALPPEASYHRKSGRASVDVKVKGDTVYVSATCDSLQRLVNYYERLYRREQGRSENYRKAVQTASESISKRLADPWVILLAVLIPPALIIAATAILIRKINKTIK